MRGGEALHPVAMSTTITVSGGKGGDVLLVDGPYAEAKEVLGGYFLLEVADLDEAIAWAGEDRASPDSPGTRVGAPGHERHRHPGRGAEGRGSQGAGHAGQDRRRS